MIRYQAPWTSRYAKPLFQPVAQNQYALAGQDLTLISGHDFCGEALSPGIVELCFNGSENIANELNGLVIDVTTDGNKVLSNCGTASIPECPNRYTCEVNPGFSQPQCVVNIQTAGGDVLSVCDTDGCTPDA